MKVLLIHAYYQQLGGEDLCFEAEVRLLESRGIEVQTYTFDNHEVDRWSTSRKALNLLWNGQAHSDVTALIDKFRPDVVHVYNTFPGLSGAVFSAAHGKGVPSVAMLSNYRITCVNGLLFRQGSVCESCLGSKLAWRGALHGCYRDSRVMSAAVAGSNAFHWLRGTWSEDISAFVALDEDGRDRFVQVGLPAARLHVRPNFMDPLPDPGSGEGEFALYAGRLAHGKGLKTLLRAWRDHEDLPDLRIAGDGPLLEASRQAADSDTRIRLLGGLSPDELATVMGEAMMTVVPSESYETFGRVAMESMALGTPVVSSTSGALKNVVRDGVGGLLFEPGQSGDLANAVCRVARGRGPSRSSTREDAAKRFSGDAAFSTLMEVYSAAGVNVPLTLRPPKEGLDRQALRTQRGMRTPRGRAYPTG